MIAPRHLAQLAAILRGAAGERLLGGLAAPDWLALVELANRHRLAPLLQERLLPWAESVPADARAYLARLAALNAERNAALRGEIRHAVAVLNGVGIAPMLLKGAAALMEARLAVPRRMVGDIDLLVQPGAEAAALAALQGAGYGVLRRYDGHAHSVADLVRRGAPAALDLHRALLDPPFRALLPAGPVLQRALRRESQGLRYRVPAREDHALHLVLHAQLQDPGYYYRMLLLGPAHELAALAPLDWPALQGWAEAHGLRPMLDSLLLAAGEFFGLAWPLAAPALAVARHHHARAMATEVSGRWDAGIGAFGRLRETFAADRLVANFGPQGSHFERALRHGRLMLRRHGLRGLMRRMRAA